MGEAKLSPASVFSEEAGVGIALTFPSGFLVGALPPLLNARLTDTLI